MRQSGIKWVLGICVFSEHDSDGYLTVQPDGDGDEPRLAPYQALHPLGFAARPQDPDVDAEGNALPDGAASALVGTEGNDNYLIPLEDVRGVSAFPSLKKGGSAQYAVPAQKHENARLKSFDVHDGDNGTKTIYIEFVDPDDDTVKAHLITVGVDGDGQPVIEMIHGRGQGVSMVGDYAMLRNKNGTRYVSVNDDSVDVNGDQKVNGSIAAGADVKSGTGVSLELHFHGSAMGPTGPAIPTP